MRMNELGPRHPSCAQGHLTGPPHPPEPDSRALTWEVIAWLRLRKGTEP